MTEIIETYNHIAKRHAQTRTPGFYEEEFNYFHKKLPRGKVIDIACGGGRDAALFVPAGYEYVGIDGSHEMIKIAKKNNPGVKFEVMNFNNLAFPDSVFDGFWAVAAFLHTRKTELETLLSGVKRVLKPGAFGMVCMKEEGKSWEGVVREKRFDEEVIERFFAYYSQSEFASFLENSGFQIDKKYIKHKSDKNWQVYFVTMKV